MDELYPDSESRVDLEEVVCTVGLGLHRKAPRKGTTTEMVLKPQVIICATLDELMT
jgi:hypothetical protein